MTLTLDRPRNRQLGFAAVLACAVMELLDSTVVTVAAPDIRADLGGSYALVQWMSVGYTLAMAALLLVGGRLGDILGRRRMQLGGLAGFTAASVLCAVAPSAELLVSGRILQGVAGAMMLPQVFGLVRDIFPPADVPKAHGALGPVVGGLLVDADLFGTGWRAIFLVNVPIGIAALVLGRRHLPAVAPSAAGARLDVASALLAAAGAVLLTFPLVQAAGPATTGTMLVAAALAFAALGRRQLRLRREGRSPLVEPGVFRHRSYVAGAGFAVTFIAAMGALFTIGAMLQIGLGYSPLAASLTMAPWAIGATFGSVLSGVTMARLGRRLLHAGLVLMAAGILGLVAVYQGGELGFAQLVVPMVVGGFGMGMIFVPLYDIILADVDGAETGSATGVLKSVDQLGAALGVAVLGTVFFTQLGEAPTVASALHAGTVTGLAAVALLAAAFALGFLLPREARAH